MAWTTTAHAYRFPFFLLQSLLLLLTASFGWAQTLPPREGLVADSTELRVLRQFYFATDGPQWSDHTNWLHGTTLDSVATWRGVRVQDGDVVILAQYNNHLVGSLPASLGQLAGLQTLDLRANQLGGTLPASLGQLSQLQLLWLANNMFQGDPPATLSQLTQLRDVRLDANAFSSLPAGLFQWTQLNWFSAADNKLSGSLPSNWSQLSRLQGLDLARNKFNGTLPELLGQCTALQYLYLSDNQFSGQLPARWGQLTELHQFALARNQLTGTLPTTFTNLAQLYSLDLSYNLLDQALPAQLAGLRVLGNLDLSHNQLPGQLPAALGRLAHLEYVDLSYNQFNGPLPDSLGQGRTMRWLYLSHNQFDGVLPTSLAQLPLYYLIADHNNFSGPIPRAFQHFTQLGGLDLSYNQLTGTVPDSLQAAYLVLNDNALDSLSAGYAAHRWNSQLLVDNNHLRQLPSFLGLADLNRLQVTAGGNYLDFASLEPNWLPAQRGTPSPGWSLNTNNLLPPAGNTLSRRVGEAVTLNGRIGGAHNHYQWQQLVNGQWTNLPRQTEPDLRWAAVTVDEAGTYRTQVSNDWVLWTVLYSRALTLTIEATVLPPDNPDENRERNWTLERSFDGNGNEVAASKQFTDGLGRPTQAQARNAATQQVFAAQTIYNTGGQPVLQTMAAPINNQSFNYKEGFIQAGAQDYGPTHFEEGRASSPTPVDALTIGTLGYYYSQLNAAEPLTPITSYPYSLVEPYEGPLGGTRRAAGPGDELRMGKGREAKGRDFPLRKEFDSYLALRPQFVPGSPLTSLEYQGMKSVSVNADGRESIVVTNKEDQAIISCLSGAQYPALPVDGYISAEGPTNAYDPSAPVYQDIHLPAAGPQEVKLTMDPVYKDGGRVLVVNLLTTDTISYALKPTTTGAAPEQRVTLAPGFYRLVSVTGTQRASYEAHYGNFSFTYYDDAGRVIATVAPKGLDVTPAGLGTSATPPVFVTRNTYDTRGQLLATESNDEGRSEYVYALDGRIRFSQSALQRKAGRFSYSNYDEVGRVVESGEYTPGNLVFENHLTASPAATSVLQASLLEDRTRTGGLAAANCAQRNQVWYDLPWDGSAGSLGTDSQLGSRRQEFVVGAVAKTQNENVTTWYSYDELGRVTWVVQDIAGVGVKTLDYTYDFSGNVLTVTYQKNRADSFYHYYSYDAAQRLTKVYTSPNGTTQTLQAEYSYYLHGPLKRVQVAGNLQGVDYTYTLQGALKAINHVDQKLEPGHDAPATNGVYKDLFALNLDYFSGDYRSKAIDAPLPTTGAASVPTRYDGTIQSATWRTGASADMHRVAYVYDEKSQLQNSRYGQWQWQKGTQSYLFNLASADALQEGNLSYDANGNMQSLRRTDQAGKVTDNFSYLYKPTTNQLKEVHTGSASGATVLDYDYDELGQMTRQRDEKGQRYLTYDVTGKTTGVYLDEAHTRPLVQYAYDDRGFRVRQTVYPYPATGEPAHVTTYVRDVAGNLLALYEQATPTSPALRSEVPLYGASRLGNLTHLADGTATGRDDYRYELTDHLGDARVVFHRPTTTVEVETMELSGVPPRAAFLNDNLYRVAADGAPMTAGGPRNDYVARLTNSQPLGQELKRVLEVTKGDTITFSALAQWNQNATAGGSSITPFVLVGAVAGLNALSQRGPEAQTAYRTTAPNWLAQLAAGLGFTLGRGNKAASLGATSLEGWIKYRVLDKQGNQMLDAQGRDLAGVDYVAGTGQWEYLQTGVRVPDNGVIEVMAGTSGSGEAVYFDNLRVEQTGGLIVQEQHQYAYGAPLPGLSYVVGNRRYRSGYQGQYAEHDSLTGFESFELRLYNSRIGRWMSYDPEGQFSSPYVGMGNNTVSGLDPDGGFSGTEPWGIAAKAHALGNVAVTGSRATLSAWARIGVQAASSTLRVGERFAQGYGQYGLSMGATIADDAFAGGLSRATAPYRGYERQPRNFPDAAGQFMGHLVGTGWGLMNMAAGTIGMGGGGVLSLSGVGATLGVPIAGAGAMDFAYGTAVTGNGFVGLISSGRAMLNMGGRGNGKSGELSSSDKNSIKTLQKRISEHKQKLQEWLANPEAQDHKGFLKNIPTERRQQIIDSRARHLQHEIDVFEENIQKILSNY
ncbi:MAG: hypothetical protein ACRYF0_06450 [Janthinobacterium lividum]